MGLEVDMLFKSREGEVDSGNHEILKPHSTKNKIKLAPQWTPNIKGYYGKKEKARHRRDAARSLTIRAPPSLV